jgi:hypothetical protein
MFPECSLNVPDVWFCLQGADTLEFEDRLLFLIGRKPSLSEDEKKAINEEFLRDGVSSEGADQSQNGAIQHNAT